MDLESGLPGFLSIPLLISAPFFLAGGPKIVHALLRYRSFHRLKPPEEQEA